jgi:hypothetical protein
LIAMPKMKRLPITGPMRERRSMNDPANALYPTGETGIWVLFDLRYPGIQERLRREQDAWRGFAHVESLAEGRSALIILPGGAARLAA